MYNNFRVSKGLATVLFDNAKEHPNREIKINMCFDCHLEAFADAHNEYLNDKQQNQDAYQGGIFDSIGVNTHYARECGDKEIMMDTKRKFPVKTALHGHQFRAARKFDWD